MQGGIIVQYLATHFEERLHRYVVVNTGAIKPSKEASQRYLEPDAPIHIWEGMNDPEFFFPQSPAGDAGLCRYIKLYRAMPKDEITAEEIRAQRSGLMKIIKENDIYEKLGNITHPMLIVVGTKLGEGPGSYELLSKVAGSAIIGFEDAAHGAVFQNALLAAAVIHDFLDSAPETISSAAVS